MARFNAPYAVAVDGAGNVYVADFFNAAIRRITPAGTVTTLAGLAGQVGMADGTGTMARFNQPYGVAVDASGDVFVADTYNRGFARSRPAASSPLSVAQIRDSITRRASAWTAPAICYVADGDNQAIAEGTLSRHRHRAARSPVPPSAGQTATFTVGSAGSQTTYQWQVSTNAGATWVSLGNNSTYSGATTPTLGVGNATTAMTGDLFRAELSDAAGTSTSGTATLTVTPSVLPVFTTQPQGQTVATGTTTVFNFTATGGTILTCQWFLNGTAIAGATGSMLVIQATAAGNYTCLLTNASGSTLSNPAALAVTTTTNPGRLINLSTLAVAGGGSQLLTVGFFTGGTGTTGSQSLLVQALGPTLSSLSVTGVMPDPQLNVFTGQTIVGSNTGWGTPLSNQLAVIAADTATYATALANPASKDSALVTSVAPGGYTVEVSSVSGVTGKTLAALYDNTPSGAYAATTPRLINLSCRLQVAANSSLTAGFWIGGTTAKTVLIRADGPAMLAQNITGVMPDPQLTVFNAAGNVIASNAGWGGSPALASIFATVYAQPFTDPNSKDSAIVLTLPPGGYTAEVTSVSNAAGNVMIEVYEVQ